MFGCFPCFSYFCNSQLTSIEKTRNLQANAMSKIERDKATIRLMIDIYCNHKLTDEKEREAYACLSDYACKRLENCRYGERKPACKDCDIHCYAPEKREMMKKVMQWTGSRMLFHSPMAVFRHIWQCVERLWLQGKRKVCPFPTASAHSKSKNSTI